MKITRDPIAINSVGEYLGKQSEALKSSQTKIIQHINSILNSYKGIGAEESVLSYIEKVKQLNSIIENFEYYANYMKSLAVYDTDNLNSTKKNLTIINEQPIDDLDNLTTINFSDSIIGGDENV